MLPPLHSRKRTPQAGPLEWQHLKAFLDNVDAPPDNNSGEAALRIVAKTRDSSLFVGHDRAGENLGVLLTLAHSAVACGHNPQLYLAHVLLAAQTTPAARLDDLLPDVWVPPSAA